MSNDDEKDNIISFVNQLNLNKKDLEIILEVNKKAVEIETEVAGQNEEIIDLLNDCKDEQKKILEQTEKILEQTEKVLEQTEQTSKDLFKIQVLFITGLLALVGQIIQLFLKK